MSNWVGQSELVTGRIHYSGPAGENASHRHAALQLVTEGGGVKFGEEGRFPAPFFIRPMVEHQLEPAAWVELHLIEPSSRLGQILLDKLPPGPIGHLPEDVLPLVGEVGTRVETLPPSLTRALDYLSGEDAMQRTVTDAARVAGVSVSRLRAMAKDRLGVSLSRWRLWQALQAALGHLANGSSVADAAFAAGFSDQAHLTRSMKTTLGLTPGVVAQTVRRR